MSEEDLQEKALGSARLFSEWEGPSWMRAAVLHQHIGSRAMGDMVIETFAPNPDKGKVEQTGAEREEGGGARPLENQQTGGTLLRALQMRALQRAVPMAQRWLQTRPRSSFQTRSPSSVETPSVEIVHGIMHLYKTNKMTSLTEDVRRSAMLCILTVPLHHDQPRPHEVCGTFL
ncbi:hypothetical protein J4Q44_G00132510 [Coregonus suidteri]|uniref:Uncharacterized protein n=1 Tax=Coregonus suidteri TaxID=861788 RepID=A0AAN8R6V4_9TELE